MKYLTYTGIVLWTLIRKTIGLFWFFVVVYFRAYARNTVYNYVLTNNIYLKRLLERPISSLGLHKAVIYGVNQTFRGYKIEPYHNTDGGYIIYRKVSYLEYKLVYWFIWGWLDDDSNYDTVSKGYIESIIKGQRRSFVPKFMLNILQKELDGLPKYGNSFDLGDTRGNNPYLKFFSSFLWVTRNTAYNFKYMQFEKRSTDKEVFLKTVFGRKFGWEPEIDYPLNRTLVFFKK